MGYSENLHSYLKMTRKELQQLCKRHKIPANRSHAHLAKSLASLCKPQININTVQPSTANKRSSKYSYFTLGNLGENYQSASDIRKTNATRLLGLVGNEIGKRNGFSEPTNSNQKFLHDAFMISRTCNTTTVQCRQNKAIKCSTERMLSTSADEISTRAPSFQFFVMSEAGINLYVDLESIPVEWINSLKQEVCIHQKGEHHESSARACHLPHADDNVEKLPSGDNGIELQINEVEQNNECTDSASSSVVSENDNLRAYPPDAIIATSASSVFTSGNAPRCLEENQVDSSSHFTHLRAHGGAVFVREGADASDRAAKNVASSLSNAPLKDTTNADNVTVDCPTDITSSDYGDFKASAPPPNTSNHISAKNNLSYELKNTLEHFGSIRKQSEVVEDLISRSPMSEVPDKAHINGGPSNLCQFTGQVVLDGATTDAQSDVWTESGQFNQQTCGSSGTSVFDVPLSSLDYEMDFSTPTRGKDSEDARAESSLDNSCNRFNNLELLQELPSKKQQVCCENMNQALIHLKGTRSLGKEIASDAIITPRGSTRLVPKPCIHKLRF